MHSVPELFVASHVLTATIADVAPAIVPQLHRAYPVTPSTAHRVHLDSHLCLQPVAHCVPAEVAGSVVHCVAVTSATARPEPVNSAVAVSSVAVDCAVAATVHLRHEL